MLERIRQWARSLRRDVLALWLARRHPLVPWHAKALSVLIAAYALSPVDLIPDFIPVLGYLDELLLIPLLIALVVRLIPAPVMAELRLQAERLAARPRSRVAAAIIVALWLAFGAWLTWWLVSTGGELLDLADRVNVPAVARAA